MTFSFLVSSFRFLLLVLVYHFFKKMTYLISINDQCLASVL